MFSCRVLEFVILFFLCAVGLVVSLVCYLQYYPSPLSTNCEAPLAAPYSTSRTLNGRRKYFSGSEDCV